MLPLHAGEIYLTCEWGDADHLLFTAAGARADAVLEHEAFDEAPPFIVYHGDADEPFYEVQTPGQDYRPNTSNLIEAVEMLVRTINAMVTTYEGSAA
jgi:hypothetical protein